jgi:lipopolysaccharide/colanic/teichoic acid biosynthesis glycosyltransferase
MMKRILDIIFAIVLGIMLTPLALIITLAIQLEARGPVLYNSERVGKDGRRFFYHRLRRTKGTPGKPPYEFTRVGRFIGNLSLDEIPMLWNILKGELSFIGPRPEKPEKVDLNDPDWQQILAVKPGLMSLGGLTFPDQFNQTSVKDRIQPDVYYAENQSIQLDMEILFKTLYFWVRMGHLKGKH